VSRLLQLQDEERRRIAAQLFDVTAQDLFAISLSLSGLQPMVETPSVKSALAKCRELCEQNIQGIRSLSDVLHPPLLDRFGLAFALESYIEGFVKRNGIAVELQVASGLGRFPLSTETNLFRIVEEGLSNIVRHSGNTAATVRAERQENFVILRIEDFGQGLPAAAMVAISSGAGDLGLVVLGMRERMRQIGGSLEIRSTNRGTVLTASVPLD
jgi:signal transduction histidine kinase